MHSPAVDENEIFQGRISAAKYQSSNPLAQKLVRNFLTEICALAVGTGASEAHEVGCGEGQITGLLAQRGLRVRGTDISPEDLSVARSEAARAGLQIEYDQRSIYELDPAMDAAELVLCCEVLEHLTDPETALRRLAGIAGKHLIVSVPHEPLWRILNLCRLKYVGSFGNTPGHLNHWSVKQFSNLVEKFVHIDHVRTPHPWIVICGRPR